LDFLGKRLQQMGWYFGTALQTNFPATNPAKREKSPNPWRHL